LRAARRICPEEIQSIYISDWMQTEGQRAYEHLYLFTNTYIIESANFATDTNVNIEVTVLKDRVKYVIVKYNDYFEKANTASRLSVRFYTNGGAYELKGAKENCDKLIEVYDKYVRPNISKVPIPE
jgi:3-deoxy-D-manno-octulosonic acid (KDO) 8-phosphate synthase